MAMEGDMWDDSALINAFDQAMSKYKKMHIRGYKEDSARAGDGKKQGAKSHVETDDGRNQGSHLAVEMGEENNQRLANGNEGVDTLAHEEQLNGTNGQSMQESLQYHSNTQGVEDYNELYKQYYEVEAQRQLILQKLQQFGGWTYPCAGEGSSPCEQLGMNPVVQGHQFSEKPVPSPAVLVTCCPYGDQCPIVPGSLLPSCHSLAASAGPCSDPAAPVNTGEQSVLHDADITRTAMRAIEGAISTLKENSTDRKEENTSQTEVEQSTCCGADLSEVLNAWYSAGFYTGKYLTEQSLAKSRHG